MSELAHLTLIGLAGVGIGYFVPRSRDVMTRVSALTGREEEQEREQAQAGLREFVDALPIAAFTVGARDTIERSNDAASRLFDRTREEMQGKAVVEATGSFELDRMVIESRASGRSSKLVEYGNIAVHAVLRAFVNVLDDGTLLFLLLDESAIVDAERVRREFLANVSHELRTPLAGMKLMVETLDVSDDPQTRAYFLPRVAREIERMIELVEHFLAVARSEAGQIRLEKRPIELSAVVEEALELVRPRFAELRIRLACELEPVELDADPARLSQVVLNFVENAMRHTPGEGTITVRCFREDGDAVIEVADTGSGIPFKDLPHLFERFYVVERSRAKNRGGLGVGLAIVKRNVEAHGGSVNAISEFGSGSTFTARIPLAS